MVTSLKSCQKTFLKGQQSEDKRSGVWVPKHRHLASLGVPYSIKLSLQVEQVS